MAAARVAQHNRIHATAVVLATVVLAGVAVTSLLAAAYFLYEYAWSGHRQFTTVTGPLTHYVLPAVLAVLSGAALRLKPDPRINLGLVVLALVISVCAGELMLGVLEPTFGGSGRPLVSVMYEARDKHAMAAKLRRRYGVEIDLRDSFELITELRSKGIDAVPFVIPRYQMRANKTGNTAPRLLSLGGISGKLTVLCNESGQHVRYESDEHGFRNPKGIWTSRRVNIVAVGDSFTQGFCVADGKTFVDIVRQRYPATLNLGMAGEGPLLQFATLQEYTSTFKPKVVLWFYFEGNDLLDLQDERESPVLLRYLDDDRHRQGLIARQKEIDDVLLDFVETAKRREGARREEVARKRIGRVGEVLNFLRLPMLRSKLGLLEGTSAEAVKLEAELAATEMRLLRRILSRAKERVAGWGGALYFVYLPNWTRYDKKLQNASDQRVAEGQRAQVLALVKDLRIPVIDLLPAFDGQSDPMLLFPFGGPGHYSERGHRLVGEQVLQAIEPLSSDILR